jgi:hypothetical protein
MADRMSRRSKVLIHRGRQGRSAEVKQAIGDCELICGSWTVAYGPQGTAIHSPLRFIEVAFWHRSRLPHQRSSVNLVRLQSDASGALLCGASRDTCLPRRMEIGE